MSQKLQTIRGTRDIFGEDAKLQSKVVQSAMHWAAKYNFQDFHTPIFEFSEVFHRTLGDTSDIVSKETYTFLDRDKTSITLRPEFTAGIVRAIISNGLTQTLPQKLFSWGPVFRHERPQKARYRQFNQLNFEFIGAKSPLDDVELISIAHNILQSLGLSDHVTLEINSLGDLESRTKYREALRKYLEKYKNNLSEDSLNRLEKNPMRILDSKDEGDKKIVADAPKIEDYFSDETKDFFAKVLEGLDSLGIAYKINPKLVRGLDYYTHTVFEFTTKTLGSQGTVLAGGRYDGLVELMGGPSTPAVGFAVGVERLCEMMKNLGYEDDNQDLVVVLPLGEATKLKSLEIAQNLRKSGINTTIEFGNNLGKMMKKADKLGATHAIIIGEDELSSNSAKVKNLGSGDEKSIAIDQLAEELI